MGGEGEREREGGESHLFSFPVTTGIPSVYIVLSLIDKQEQYSAPKYRCTNEQKARKVTIIIIYPLPNHCVTKLPVCC